MLFHSKIDWWLYLSFIVVVVVMVASVLPPVITGQINLLWGALLLVISLGLPFWMFSSTNYRVDNGELTIKSGPIKWVIPLSEIESVVPSRSIFSGPALSIDRLQLTYSNGKRILISPKDKEGFLEAISHTG